MTNIWPAVDLASHGSVDPRVVEGLMADICAAEMVPRFRDLDPSEIFEKGPGDLVTVVDRTCETLLEKGLAGLVPGAGFVGEETVAAKPETLSQVGQSGPVWVVDPLDGTANFSAGRDEFGMIVALLLDGEAVGGWIHLPMEGRTFYAAKGQGVHVSGGPALGPIAERPVASQSGIFNIPSAKRHAEQAAKLTALKDDLGTYGPSRCSAYAYSRIASGSLDFVIYRGLKPWDHAAGILMVGEAGGASAHLSTGLPYVPTDTHGPLVVAGSAGTLEAVRARLSV